MEEQVIQRNRTITTYYAQLYQNEPYLYKWAGMAAFASFHIGEKLQLWDWEDSGIQPLSITCNKKNRTIEDDFQIIRIINNRIFSEIGWVHLAFCQMDYESFSALLMEQKRHPIIIHAFKKLNDARVQLNQNGHTDTIQELIWEANTDILWHEQSEVVQPLFDRLSNLFSRAMTLFASLDYKINHNETNWLMRSRFMLFILLNGFELVRKNGFIPQVTNLEHRWFWIQNDVLKRWKAVEANRSTINSEIEILSKLEDRKLKLYNFE